MFSLRMLRLIDLIAFVFHVGDWYETPSNLGSVDLNVERPAGGAGMVLVLRDLFAGASEGAGEAQRREGFW